MPYNNKPLLVVIGIAARGTTPYVFGTLKHAQKKDIVTGAIVCNTGSPISEFADFTIESSGWTWTYNREYENEK